MSRVEPAILDGRIHQGDLFTSVEVPLIDSLRDPGRIPEVRLEPAAHLLVVTQDCDLLWDREARVAGTTSEEKVLRGALVIPGWPADQVRAGMHREGATKIDRDLWKPIVQNMHPRWYFLKRDEPLAPVDMLFDIRAYSSVPPVYLERQWMGQRIARLGDLWSAHLLQRVTAYLGRIALPDDPPVASGA